MQKKVHDNGKSMLTFQKVASTLRVVSFVLIIIYAFLLLLVNYYTADINFNNDDSYIIESKSIIKLNSLLGAAALVKRSSEKIWGKDVDIHVVTKIDSLSNLKSTIDEHKLLEDIKDMDGCKKVYISEERDVYCEGYKCADKFCLNKEDGISKIYLIISRGNDKERAIE